MATYQVPFAEILDIVVLRVEGAVIVSERIVVGEAIKVISHHVNQVKVPNKCKQVKRLKRSKS